MWWGWRRIRRLEDEVAQGRADQQELRRRLEAFETIAAAAGTQALPKWWEAAVPAAPMPASLLAAARSHGPGAEPVWLQLAGTDVIAIIGGPGDPREWWSAVWQVAERAGESA